MAASPEYRFAHADTRSRFDHIRTHHVVSIPMWVTGTVDLPAGPSAPCQRAETIDLNHIYYQPALYAPADYVITSSAVGGRYEADAQRFRPQIEFYRFLDSRAERVTAFSPRYTVSGPVVQIYRVTAACRAALRGRPTSRWWWLPQPAAASVKDFHGGGEAPPARSAWMLGEWQPIYQSYFSKFAAELAFGSLIRGDTLTAERLAASAVAVDSTNTDNAMLYSVCLERRGDLERAGRVLRGALAANPQESGLLRSRIARLEARRAHED
jgi:hypothetical protein